MKKIKLFFVLLLCSTLLFGQRVEVSLSHFQSFYHDKNVETNYAVKTNKISYTDAYYTDDRLIFDLDNKVLIQIKKDVSDTLKIREVRRNSDVMEVDVIYPNPLLVNYFLSTTTDNTPIILCRWVKDDKIVGWADKYIKVKRG